MNRLYPHYIGHWIGLDLHDTPQIPRNTLLKRGMTVTIEPGLYIPATMNYPPELQGTGIRIEDDIAVGNKETGGPWVLTAEAPKEVEDLEFLMTKRDTADSI